MSGPGLVVCASGAVIGMDGLKLSIPHLVLLSGTWDNQADGAVRLDNGTAKYSERTAR